MKSLRMFIDAFSRKSFLLLLLTVIGCEALKDVSVIVPLAAKIKDTVTLQCKYNLEGDLLYTVKWYKGQKEFFTFIPKELPNIKVFHLPGFDVDLNKSNANEVVLRNVQADATGRYKCEVSSESPDFYTHMTSSFMYVIDVPTEEPVMTIEKESLELGYTIRGNCTTPPSYPPVNVTWFLNGKHVNGTSQQIPDPNAIPDSTNRKKHMRSITLGSLELDIDANTFQGGKARITCVSSLYHLYKKEKEEVLEEDRPRPRPSSVLGTRDNASDSPVLAAQLLINAAALLFICLR